MVNTLENLRDIVMREIDQINQRGELDENSLVCAYKLVDIVKDIEEIEEKEEGYSQRGYSMMYPHYMMDNGNSYRGMSNNSYGYSRRNRDSMGRYSRDTERENIMAKIGHMMDTAASETERQTIQRIMNQL